jgi:pantoate--beta-alanine ligase
MVRVIEKAADLLSVCDGYRRRGERVGLVPTMGALHRGHLSLVEAARRAGATRTVLTIFVNPTQFGAGEDLDRYPRTMKDDLERCEQAGVDLVYAPEVKAVYPPGFQTFVQVEELTAEYEGRFRPTHFRGVTTIVTKLFHAAGPCLAAFGRKDYQQWRVIERMARDLDLPVEIMGCPTVREEDGLAMSSRNRYLDPGERERALAIYRGLCAAGRAFESGEREAAVLERLASDPVQEAFDRIDYVALADARTLARCQARIVEPAVVLVAAHIGQTRLIDNAVLGEDRLQPPVL